jgi:hypothetical protein
MRTTVLTQQELDADLAALDAAEARHLVEAMVDHGRGRETPQRRAAGGGSALQVPAGFTAGEAFQAGGKALTCACGFSVSVFPSAGRFAVLLSSDDQDTPPHTLGDRQSADKAALMIAAQHSESCEG